MKDNPFDIPGFSTSPDNPLLSSLNMMQQIWGNMAKTPMGLSPQASALPTLEDLTKRIEDLQAVESWLRLNLSMLSSTIQGLEIQRSTLTTLQSMAKSGLEAMPNLASLMPQAGDESTEAAETIDAANESLRQAGQAWWDLLQNQFESIASATAQSMQQAQNVAENLSSGVGGVSADTTFKAKKTASKALKKTAAKKTSVTSNATKSGAKKASKKTASKAAKKTS